MPGSTAHSSTATATCSNESTSQKPGQLPNPTSTLGLPALYGNDLLVTQQRCTRMAASTQQLETHAYPKFSANTPGAQPDWAHPSTSTNSATHCHSRTTNRRATAATLKNATKTSPLPAPPTAKPYGPAQRLPADRLKTNAYTTPVAAPYPSTANHANGGNTVTLRQSYTGPSRNTGTASSTTSHLRNTKTPTNSHVRSFPIGDISQAGSRLRTKKDST